MSGRLICQCWQISYNLTHWLHFITIKTRTQEQTNARHTDDCPELTLLRLCIKCNLRNDLSTASHQSRTGLTPSVVVVATVHRRRLDLDGFGYPKAAGISSPWNYYNKLTYPVDLIDVNEHIYGLPPVCLSLIQIQVICFSNTDTPNLVGDLRFNGPINREWEPIKIR